MIRSITKTLILAYLVIVPCTHASILFQDDAVLSVQLKGPLKTIFRNRKQEREEPFVLTIDGVAQTVWVSTRGNSRKRWCKFPPLRLRIEETNANTSVLGKSGNLIGTVCTGVLLNERK